MRPRKKRKGYGQSGNGRAARTAAGFVFEPATWLKVCLVAIERKTVKEKPGVQYTVIQSDGVPVSAFGERISST